jgi:ATP-binding cassette, subfamily B, bacterial
LTQAPVNALQLFARLLIQARHYWPHLLGCQLLSLCAVPLSLLTPLPIKIAVDHVLGGQPLPQWLAAAVPGSASAHSTLLFAAALLVGTMLLLLTQSLICWFVLAYLGQKLTLGFRARLFEQAQRLSLLYHDRAGSSDSAYRIQYDAPAIQHVAVDGVIPIITSLTTLLGMIWVTTTIDLKLAVIALGVAPILYVLAGAFGGRLRDRWGEVKNSDSSAMAVIHESLSSLRVVKAFGAENRERQRFVERAGRSVTAQVDVARIQGLYDLLVGLTLAVGSALGLYVGVTHVQSGLLTLGQLLMVITYLAMLYEPMHSLSGKVADLQGSLASAQRAFALLDHAPDVPERPDARTPGKVRGEIAFDAVGFGYNEHQAVLHDVSFRIPAGARVGIQGATGAGKSTLMSLLTRFYDPTAGGIRLDGIDLRDYRLEALRSQFAIVLQDTVLFSTTIAENIAYGRPDASADEIAAAARMANAHEFICKLPEGYQTSVGERGMTLSGGERQRIALARAFLRNAPILILDEPTSAVDTGTESRIVEAIERLMQGRTTFMIAHRLSTLEGCDVQLHVEGGRVVQTSPTTEAQPC